jgi:hypothetical protein
MAFETRPISGLLHKIGMVSAGGTSTRREQFNNILMKYGHSIYLQRRCTISSPEGPYEKHPDSCSGCLGHGFSQTIERHMARKDVVMGEMAMPQSLVKTPMGIVPSEDTYYYVKHDVNPKEGDRVLEWMTEENKYRVYKINKAIDMRGDGGNIIYWVIACEFEE